MNILTITDLTIGYGTCTIARRLSATLTQGTLTALLGNNGVGKSTLLRTIAGFLPPITGSIHIAGSSLRSLSRTELSRLVGLVLTEPIRVDNMTVFDILSLARSPYTGFLGRLAPQDRDIIDQAAQNLGIQHLMQRKLGTLSDGERQKLMIAKALAQQTPIIVLDEPTSFLDFPAKIELLQLLRCLAHEHNKTILLSTHDIEPALRLSDQLWLLSPQGTLTQGPPAELGEPLAHLFNSPYTTYDPQTACFLFS